MKYLSLLIIILVFYLGLNAGRGDYEKTIKTYNDRKEVIKRDRELEISIQNKSRSIDRLSQYFKLYGSPLLGTEKDLYEISKTYKLDARIFIAFARKESSLGTHACGFNIFGISSCRMGFTSYKNAYEYFAKLLTTSHYYANWRETGNLYDLVSVYCPKSDNCNVDLYVSQIKQWMEEI